MEKCDVCGKEFEMNLGSAIIHGAGFCKKEIKIGSITRNIEVVDPYFDLAYGESYCELGNSNSSSQHCSTCATGKSHQYDELRDAGVSGELLVFADGRTWSGREISRDGSRTFGWNETVFRFRPEMEDRFKNADISAVRRRIEDRLRKNDNEVKEIAVLLGVKITA